MALKNTICWQDTVGTPKQARWFFFFLSAQVATCTAGSGLSCPLMELANNHTPLIASRNYNLAERFIKRYLEGNLDEPHLSDYRNPWRYTVICRVIRCKILTWLWEIPTFVLTAELVEPDFFGVWAALVWEWPATEAKYWITFLVFSVFPAPDSPLNTQIQQKKFTTWHPKEFTRDQLFTVSIWEQKITQN